MLGNWGYEMQINSVGDDKINSSSKFISSKQPDKYLILYY